jgi:plasmid stabilization system protein ParE
LRKAGNLRARHHPAAAARFVESMFTAVAQLTDYPALGRQGRVAGTKKAFEYFQHSTPTPTIRTIITNKNKFFS